MKIIVAALCAVFFAGTAFTAGLEFPRACYTGDELAAVKAWEKNWVNRRIAASNVAEVMEFLPESFSAIMRDTRRWGQSWFVIVPYRQILPTPGTVALTKKFYGQPRIDAQGEIVNWIAGVPFPDAASALEMAHNFRRRNSGDSMKTDERGYVVDGRLKYDMKLEIHNNYLFFSGRTDVPPVPELPGNPRGIWRAFSFLQIQPPETRNMRILELHYKDPWKAYESWLWMPSIRRVRRRSTSERQDAQGGADFCGFDNFGWDGPVAINTYAYLGRKELLLARHNDSSKLEHKRGECLWNGVQRERIKAHVIEVASRDPDFLYSKMIWYLDPETWQILYSDRFDRDGKLWKVLDQHCFVAPGTGSAAVNAFNSSQMIDVQRTHATLATAGYEFGIDLPHDMFTTQYLQKYGY